MKSNNRRFYNFSRAAAPGSCGELVQGVIDGIKFHVSCPIDVYSRVSIIAGPALSVEDGPDDFISYEALAATRPKTAAAWRLTPGFLKPHLQDARLRMGSGLSPGAGMASSTADIGATVAALSRLADIPIGPGALAGIALTVEPTDGTLFPGIALFAHTTGCFRKILGMPPPLKITYIDTGGRIDTVDFNRHKLKYTSGQVSSVERALAMVSVGIKLGDARLIGAGATLSAQVNQAFLPKKELDELIFVSKSIGGYGVVVAHSGSVAGVLHNLDEISVNNSLRHLGIGEPRTVRLIGGGCFLC